MVTIRCFAYNHELYIRQCLEGFVMQKTNFRFEAIVHDDASTDGTAAIILEYAEKYPDIIKPIMETENQYSKRDGSLRRIMDAHMHGKYIAICEGDDYWTDPYKLQKQVDFLEANPEHSMCFHAAYLSFNDGQNKPLYRYNKDMIEVPVKDVILGGGGFIITNSIMYRQSKYESDLMWVKKSPIGDYPLVLMLAHNGKVAYINELMSVYRVMAINSWTARAKNWTLKQALKHRIKVIKMLMGFNDWSKHKYSSIVLQRILKISYGSVLVVLRKIRCFNN